MLTEVEAKANWCPMARVLSNGHVANRDNSNDGAITMFNGASRCTGSVCMAWRWSRAKETKAFLDAVQARMKTTGENFNVATNKVWAEIGSTFEKTEGYCGAFGRPE